MNKKRWIIAGVLCVLLVLGMALAVTFVPQNLVLGSVNNREVVGQVARRFGPARFQSDGKTATVQLGSQTSRVTADQVELPGGVASSRFLRVAREWNCSRRETTCEFFSMDKSTNSSGTKPPPNRQK